MKTTAVFLAAFPALVSAVSLEVASGNSRNVATVSSGAPSFPGPAPAPKQAGMEALHVRFEIKNLNYYDLTKVVCRKKTHMVNKAKKKEEKLVKKEKSVKGIPTDGFSNVLEDMDSAVNSAVKVAGKHAKNMADQLKKGMNKVVNGSMGVQKMKKSESLLQEGSTQGLLGQDSDNCTTVMVVLRDAIRDTILSVLRSLSVVNMMPAPGPAPYPSVVSMGPAPGLPPAMMVPLPHQALRPTGVFLQQNRAPFPAPSPAMVPAAKPPQVKIFVTFTPGREIKGGRSTMVEIAFLDTPKNGVDDMIAASTILRHAVNTKMLHTAIAKTIGKVLGMKPQLGGMSIGMKEIVQWPINKCEKHITAIVKNFTTHYTREQVPRALYNECTNFMVRMSFSHDHVLDPLDTMRCRKATFKFTEHWKYGENAKTSDFEEMCLKACEAKYGKDAPKCNIEAGDNLMNSPVL